MDNPVVRDLVAELLRGEDSAAAGHRPKSRGIQVGPPMGAAPQLVSRGSRQTERPPDRPGMCQWTRRSAGIVRDRATVGASARIRPAPNFVPDAASWAPRPPPASAAYRSDPAEAAPVDRPLAKSGAPSLGIPPCRHPA
ncbi:uncharacterized protein LOC135125746 [Zophobas morio]|uniref:uncharacterized protein LOC135125746 n=1 Tax=Zophobas morio TaxID=2755281 RepID=UPI00308285FD